jgi:hypothetical protein
MPIQGSNTTRDQEASHMLRAHSGYNIDELRDELRHSGEPKARI